MLLIHSRAQLQNVLCKLCIVLLVSDFEKAYQGVCVQAYNIFGMQIIVQSDEGPIGFG